jgi:hypothetical protein
MKITHSSDMIMGVETPIPPIMMNPAAPDGAPPRRINDLKEKCRKPFLPRCASERP